MDSWFFYWLIAAVVLAPIVHIIKGIVAHKDAKNGTDSESESE